MQIQIPINKKLILIVLLVLSLLLITAVSVSSIAKNNTANPVLFINNSCSHCEQTIEEIKTLEFEDRLKLKIRNIDDSSLYKESFNNASETCNIEEDQRGVPMLYHERTCFKGTVETLQELERLNIE